MSGTLAPGGHPPDAAAPAQPIFRGGPRSTLTGAGGQLSALRAPTALLSPEAHSRGHRGAQRRSAGCQSRASSEWMPLPSPSPASPRRQG